MQPPRTKLTLIDRILQWFHPGPLDWALKLGPPRRRFRPGPHMHGLADHDIVEKDPPSRS